MKPVIIIAMAFVLLVPTTVFAQESLIFVQTDDNHYDEGDIIIISGQVATIIWDAPVIIQVFTEGNLVDIIQLTVAQDGSFSKTLLAEGALWKNDGEYLVTVSYQEYIAESEFTYSTKSDSIAITTNFEVDAGSSGTFDVGYTVKGATIKGIVLDSDIFGLIVQIDSRDEGTITLELPREFIGAEKQDGKDNTFIILIDGIEVSYNETDLDFTSRVITINFEQGDSDITIIGTYLISAKKPASGAGDGQFRSIPEKPNVGSTIRITGYSFESLQEFDFYIDSTKVGSFVTDNTGYFMTTMKIPDTQKADRVEFIIKDSRDNEKSIDLRIGEVENRISESVKIPLTAEIAVTNEKIDEIEKIVPENVQPEELGIASFVEKSKDPQHYVDRYNNEATYKKWFDENFPQYDSIEQAVGLELTEKIPDWVKNIFGWYAADQVSEVELLNAIKYLINEGILVVE